MSRSIEEHLCFDFRTTMHHTTLERFRILFELFDVQVDN